MDRKCKIFNLESAILFIIVFAVIVSATPAKKPKRFVWVSELDGGVKRNLGSPHQLADQLSVQVRSKGHTMTLNLKKDSHLNSDIPMHFMQQERFLDITNSFPKDFAVYKDAQMNAPMIVSKHENAISLTGSFTSDGDVWSIAPSSGVNTPTSGTSSAVPAEAPKVRKSTSGDHLALHVVRLQSAGSKPTVDYELRGMDRRLSLDTWMPRSRAGPMYDVGLEIQARDTQHATPLNEAKKSLKMEVEKFEVEVLFLLDSTIWKMWLKKMEGKEHLALLGIQKHYFNVMNGIRMAFDSIKPSSGISITPRLKAVAIARTAEDSPWTSGNVYHKGEDDRTTFVSSDRVLDDFNTKVYRPYRMNFNDPDHTMMFTMYDIDGNGVQGLSTLGGICYTAQGKSLVEERGVQSWLTASHELAHNLGADHDGNNNDCDPKVNNIMSSTHSATDDLDKVSRMFQFSECSVDYFKRVLTGKSDGYKRTCLKNLVCEDQETAPTSSSSAQELAFTPEQQCKMREGSKSKLCDNNGEHMCTILYCTSPNGKCYGSSPGVADNTPCASDKVCHKGTCISKKDYQNSLKKTSECLPSETRKYVPKGCRSTTQRITIDGRSMTCRTLVYYYPQACQKFSKLAKWCCAHCYMHWAM